MGTEQNLSAMKMGTNSTISKSDSMASERPAAASLRSLPSTEILCNSDKPRIQRGHSSQDLMTLSSNSISNLYPLSGSIMTSQTMTPPGKEIFYQLPNPNKALPNTSNPLSLSSVNSESILASSSEPISFSTDNHYSNDMDDNLLAPFHTHGLGAANGMDSMRVQEIVESFNPSSVGEMDIQRFLLDENWPLK